jgi:hypothetical protein
MNKINNHKEVISEIKKLRNVLLEAEVDKSTHVNANGVRTHLNNLGYSVKPTLDEVGDITPEFASVLKKVSSAFQKEMPELKIKFGSGRDKFHQAYPNSRHNKGNANDIVFDGIKKSDDETLDKICTLLCAARKSIPGFTFIDEYRYPTKHATGNHFHISYSENKSDEGRNTKQFCDSVPASNLENFEFTEPEPYWVDMSQSDINTEINKLFVKLGVKEIAGITAESDCEDYVKDFIDAFGEKNIIKADRYCDYEIFGYKVKELAEVANEVTVEIENEEKNKKEEEEVKKEEEAKKKEEEKAKKKEEEEASLTEELKNFKRFIK